MFKVGWLINYYVSYVVIDTMAVGANGYCCDFVWVPPWCYEASSLCLHVGEVIVYLVMNIGFWTPLCSCNLIFVIMNTSAGANQYQILSI